MQRERERLTPERIRMFSCPPEVQQAFLWDADMPRLAVRATAGSKSFVFQAVVAQKTIRLTIGDTRQRSLADARKEARRLAVLVDQGIDPRQEKADRLAKTEAARVEAARADAPAMDAWQAYVVDRTPRWGEHHLASHETVTKAGGLPRSRGRCAGQSETTQPGILRPLLALPLDQITRDRIRVWLKAEASRRPTHAALAFRLLRAFLNWCSDRPEYRDRTDADACSARLSRDELPKKTARVDCLQREQLPLWFAHVRQIHNPVIAAYLQSLLLTGARREELAGLKWQDVDFQWRSLTIRDKVDGERTIPLTPYVAALLTALPRRNEWVFSSPTAASGRLQEPRIQHQKALTLAGLPALSLHGLRRSFGTLAEWVECPAGVSAQIMGHKPSATAEKHYRVRPLDLLRMWHTKIEAWILEQAEIEQPAETDRRLRVIPAA